MKKQYKQVLAVLLAVALVWNLMPNIPHAMAGQSSRYVVDEVESLPDEVLHQQVEYGTKKEDLNLPETLEMLIRAAADDGEWEDYIGTATSSNARNIALSAATASDAEESGSEWRMVHVDWVLNEQFSEAAEYNGEQPGLYVFDAELTNDRYRVGDAELPTIEVEVLEKGAIAGMPGEADGLAEKQILSWQWVDPDGNLTETEEGEFLLPMTASAENPASLEDVMELLPKEITARVAYRRSGDETETVADGKETGADRAESGDNAENVIEETISLAGWNCADYPEAGAYEGEYTFTAKLPEGCKLAEGAPELEVQVQFQGVVLLADGYGELLGEIWQTYNDVKVFLYDTNGDKVGDCVVISGNSEVYLSISDTGWNDESQITSVIIEEGVTSIGKDVCSNMLYLETVTIPSTVSSIGDRAFYQCWNLKDVKISAGVQSIGKEAFYSCASLTSISLPEGVESIGASAFDWCETLTSVSLPDTLKTVGDYAFVWCPIEKLIIPENISEIGFTPFWDAQTVYNLSNVDLYVSENTKIETVYTITRKGRDGEADGIQKVLPSGAAAGTRYEGTAYDAASYFPDGNGNSWVAYDEESGTYTEVTEETVDAVLSGASGTTGNPVLYPVRAISWDDINVEANHVGGDKTSGNKTYTLTVKDNSTGVTLEEETHYTAVITSVNGFDTESGEATSDGTQPGRVTVTITGIPEGGYMGTREVSYLVSEVASVKIGEDGEEILYTSLFAAFASVGDDQTATITLLENAAGDVTVSGNVTLTSKGDKEVEISGTVTVPSGASLALMSDTVTISATSDEIAYGVCVTGGAFVMEAGAVQAVTTGYSMAYGINIISGTAEIRGGTITAGGTIQQRGGGVRADRGTTLSVTDGNISSDGVGLFIFSDNISLSGGTVSGEYAAVYITTSYTSNTVGGILEKGYVYYDSDGAYAAGVNSMDSSLPAGTYTIGECKEHSYGPWSSADSKVHTRACERCGEEETEAHTFGEDNRCTKCTMQAAASVAIDGEETAGYYTSVEKAWAAAQGKIAVITLLADAEISEVLTVTAGSKITWQSSSDYTLFGNANETDGGLINITGGTFTLESGIVRNGENGSNAIAVSGGGSFVMNGGEAVALADGHSGICVYSGGTAEINGGSASGYNGLAIVNGGSGTVSGGTFTGTFSVADGSAAVLLRNVGSTTLKSILKSGMAYYSGTDVIAENLITDLTGRSLTGTVTVSECKHSFGTWTNAGDGTHSRVCAVCGHTEKGAHSCSTWTDNSDGKTHSGECGACGASMSEEHRWDTNGNCTAESCTALAVAKVQTGDSTDYSYYSNMKDAWVYAQENSSDSSPARIILLRDSETVQLLHLMEGNIILSGGAGEDSYTLPISESIYIWSGSLTLESGLTLSCQGDGSLICVYGGTFTMDGGEVYFPYGDNAISVSGGSAVINGGKIEGGYAGLYVNDGNVSIRGGDIYNNVTGSLASGAVRVLGGAVTIEDGTFIGSSGYGRSLSWEGGSLVVRGGTFTGGYGSGSNYQANVYAAENVGTVGGMLEEGYAWYSIKADGTETEITDEEVLSGSVLTEEARDGNTFQVKKSQNAQTISVEVTWGTMAFTYTDGAWDPETHTYGDGSWTAEENGGQIAVKNNGNTNVTVSYSYEKTETDISGSFADETGQTMAANTPVALSVGQERRTYLKLSGKPASGFTTGTLGTVKVTIGGEE
ncbi:MAG: leucine-rich repeat protein [bacterium]|nr:leucine-rich repeat protein [bacterium]